MVFYGFSGLFELRFSMWSFPQTDQSLMGWSSHLDQVSWGRPDVLARELAKFDDFYTNMWHGKVVFHIVFHGFCMFFHCFPLFSKLFSFFP